MVEDDAVAKARSISNGILVEAFNMGEVQEEMCSEARKCVSRECGFFSLKGGEQLIPQCRDGIVVPSFAALFL